MCDHGEWTLRERPFPGASSASGHHGEGAFKSCSGKLTRRLHTATSPFSHLIWDELVTWLQAMIKIYVTSAQILRDECRQVQF